MQRNDINVSPPCSQEKKRPTPEDDETITQPPIKYGGACGKFKLDSLVPQKVASAVFSFVEDSPPLPRFFVTNNGTRLPANPLAEMTESKRAAAYKTNSAADYETRFSHMQATLTRYDGQYHAAKQRQAELQYEMRYLLAQYLEVDRELIEIRCRIQHTQQAQAELARHYKPM